MNHEFRLVDVFTEQPFAGNQLAVVLDAEGLSSQRMQVIAREFNFSETTFVTATEAAGCDWRVRIFTPVEELAMAGHPTIGTAVVLEHLGRVADLVTFELGVGPTPVRVAPGWAEMEQRPPRFGAVHPDPELVAAALSLHVGDVTDPDLPVQAVSTGLPYLLVPIVSSAALAAIQPRTDLLAAALEQFPRTAMYAFTRDVRTEGIDARCRMFAPHLGTPEDAGTGSAAGCLACQLAAHAGGPSAGGGDTRRFRFQQGIEMGRPSLLEASIERSGGGIATVRVGGPACIVGEGRLQVD